MVQSIAPTQITPMLITIVGGAGFVGRYVVQELAKRGHRLRVVVRDVHRAAHLKPLGGVGQVALVAGDARDAALIDAACTGAGAVINLVGILAERGGASFDDVHVAGARNVAAAAAKAGAASLVHVSAIGADPESESAYGRSKGAGEAAVRAAFPGATILRPSILFGAEDEFVNRFAGLARGLPFVLPVVAPAARFQPAYVLDVAKAIVMAAEAPAAFAGQTFELGGPKVWSMRELLAWIVAQTYADKPLVEVPDAVAARLASLTGWLPGAPLTRDQWLMLQTPNVVAPGAAGFAAFGIAPAPLEAIAPAYLVRYRKLGRFHPAPAAAPGAPDQQLL
jgi:NADH dehydrogenase